jgi:hypothetical protein
VELVVVTSLAGLSGKLGIAMGPDISRFSEFARHHAAVESYLCYTLLENAFLDGLFVDLWNTFCIVDCVRHFFQNFSVIKSCVKMHHGCIAPIYISTIRKMDNDRSGGCSHDISLICSNSFLSSRLELLEFCSAIYNNIISFRTVFLLCKVIMSMTLKESGIVRRCYAGKNP